MFNYVNRKVLSSSSCFSDYEGTCKAHVAMKNVASLINERKRRLESIDTMAHWQEAIVRWEVRTER